MAKGRVEGFDDELKDVCRYVCAEVGDPPCWQLPDLTSDADDQVFTPCDACLHLAKRI